MPRCVIALLKLTKQLFTTSPQSLHNLCCTSPLSLLYLTTDPLDLTTIFAALCCTSPQICLHRNIFCCTSPQIHPHHDLCCISPHIRTATIISYLAYRNPTPALQKLVVMLLESNTPLGWGLKLRSAHCKRRCVKLTSLRDFSSLIFEGAF